MADRLGMIVVGAGRGRAHLRSCLTLSDRFDVVGLVDIDPARLQQALDEFGLPESLGYTSFDDALADATCDAVVIATWARTHEQLVEQALVAGKHVLVEKPFTSTLAAAQELLELPESRELKIVVTQQWRYLAGQRTVRRLMTEGAFGEPQTGHTLRYKARGGEYPDSPQSQLWQQTVHDVDSLIAMMNQPVVEVYGHIYRPPATTWNRESTATAELTFQNGCRMALVSTSDARVDTTEMRVECARAAVRYHRTSAGGHTEELVERGDGEPGFEPVPCDDGPSETADLDRRVAASFADWVSGGPEPETSGRNNLQVLAVLDGLMQSGATGARVTIAV